MALVGLLFRLRDTTETLNNWGSLACLLSRDEQTVRAYRESEHSRQVLIGFLASSPTILMRYMYFYGQVWDLRLQIAQ